MKQTGLAKDIGPGRRCGAFKDVADASVVVGMDVVEVSPPYDHAELTSSLANRVVLEVLSGMARRRRDAADGTTWDPAQPLLADRPDRRG